MQITNKDRPVQPLDPGKYDSPAAKPQDAQAKSTRVAPSAADGDIIVAQAAANTSAPASSAEKAQMTALFRQQFAEAASDPEAFHAMMKQVYGDSYDTGKAEQFRQQALKGDFSFLPDIKFVPGEALEHGNAAYNADEGVVYVNDQFRGNPSAVQSELVEEIGHHLDTKLNKTDSAGDEGELFRRVMAGEKLSAADIASIRAENDKRTIMIDGKKVEVEFIFGAIGKAIGGAVSNVGKAIGKAATNVAESVTSLPKRIGDAFKIEPSGNVFTDIWNGIKAPFKAVGEVIKTAATIAVAPLTPVFAIAGESLKLIGKAIDPLIPQPVKDWLGDAGKAIGNVLGEVAEFLAPVLAPIFAVYDFVMAPFREVLGPVFEPLGDAVTELTGHLPQPLKAVGNFAGDIIGDPATWVEVALTAGIATGVRATVAKGLGKTVMKEVGEEAAKKAAKKAIAKKAVSRGAQEAAEKAAMEAAEQMARKGAKASLKKTGVGIRKATREANKQAAIAAAGRELTQETAQKVMQEAAEKALKEAAENGSKTAIRRASSIADDTIRETSKELKAVRRASDAAEKSALYAERRASKSAARKGATQADDAAKAARRQAGDFSDAAKAATKQADDAAKAARRQAGDFSDAAKKATREADAAKRQAGDFSDAAKQATKKADDAAKRQAGDFSDAAKKATREADAAKRQAGDFSDAAKKATKEADAAKRQAGDFSDAAKKATKEADAAKRQAGNFADEAAEAARQADGVADDVSETLGRLKRDPLTGELLDPKAYDQRLAERAAQKRGAGQGASDQAAKGTERHVKFRDPSPQKLADLDEAKKLAREGGAKNTTDAMAADKARRAERKARKEAARNADDAARHADNAKEVNKRDAGEWSKESAEVNKKLRTERGKAGDYTDEMKKLLEEDGAFPTKELAKEYAKHGVIHHGAEAAKELGKERAKEELQEEGEDDNH